MVSAYSVTRTCKPAVTASAREILAQLLTFASSAAHYIGAMLGWLLEKLLPGITIPADLIDPLGYLAVLTIFLVLVQVARKLASVIIAVGWILMAVRILML